MGNLRKAAFWGYSIAIAGLAFAGILYSLLSRFMPYHRAVVDKNWLDLTAGARLLTIALIHEIGGAQIAAALAAAAILWIPFRRGETWADLTIPSILLISYGRTTQIAWDLFRLTASPTPWPIALGFGILIVTCASLCYLERLSTRKPSRPTWNAKN